jgi:phage gp36-like protein
VAVYATLADAEELYGSAYVAVACDRDNDGSVDPTSFAKHLEIASREINAYLLGRYPLPLATPPEHFKKLCTDIAIYNAAPTADVRTVEMKDRYDSAIRYLEKVAENRIKLETQTDGTEINASKEATTTTNRSVSIQVSEGSRVMTRKRLGRLM